MAVQDLIVRDFWWKMLAFVLATLIWANFGGKLDDRLEVDQSGLHLTEIGRETNVLPIMPRDVTVGVLRSADSLDLFKVEPSRVKVVIKSEAGRLKTLNPKLILAFVDATDMNEKPIGTATTRPVSRIVQLHLPSGVEAVSVEPMSVIVERISHANAPETDSKKK
ncbi:MAG TPA: hypothetical protein VGH19_12755 [Verrucomicrobiae bacterium]